MDPAAIRKRVEELHESAVSGEKSAVMAAQLTQGVLTVMHAMYGRNSPQESALTKALAAAPGRAGPGTGTHILTALGELRGVLANMLEELNAGFVGSLRARVEGDVLSDLVRLARAALDENTEGSKNVASVLTAAAFEDTIRRIALRAGLPDAEKAPELLAGLKQHGVLAGAQVGIAQSYLKFRNDALHARWDQIERASIASVLGFVEALLVQHFS